MLVGLKIENIAVIESAELEFDSGLNVMTGETGAGKSIVIDSINAVLGEKSVIDKLLESVYKRRRVRAIEIVVSGIADGRTRPAVV